MANYENRFVLKHVTKSSDEDYATALKIYSDATPQEIRTDTNEITHWLDKKDDSSPFEMIVLILYLDSVVVGFSQVTYIKSQRISILDYISLKENYRINTVFLVFFNMIQSYLSDSGRQVMYYIAEISNKDNGENIDRESALYKRIICLESFGKVESKYFNIPLGLDNFESDFDSLMYIKTNDKISSLNKDTFLAIVNAICFEYYYVWYREFLNSEESETYKSKLDTTYNNIKKATISSDRILISYPKCPLFVADGTEKTAGTIPNTKKINKVRVPIMFLAIVILPVVMAFLYQVVFSFIKIEFSTISTFVSGLVGTFLTATVAYLIGKKN